MEQQTPKPGWRKLAVWGAIFILVAVVTYTNHSIGEVEAELLWRISILFFGVNGMEWLNGMIAAWRSK